MDKRKIRIICLVEFVGSFTLLCSANLAKGSPYITGLTLLVLTYSFLYSFGACFNPIISLARLLLGQFDSYLVLIQFIIAQCLGSFAGALTAKYVTGYTMPSIPGETYTDVHSLVTEMLIMSFLVYVVLSLGLKDLIHNSSFGVVYACTCTALSLSNGPCSGAIFNPAMAASNTFVTIIFESDLGHLNHLWYYLMGHFVGGGLGFVIFKGVHGKAPNTIDI